MSAANDGGSDRAPEFEVSAEIPAVAEVSALAAQWVQAASKRPAPRSAQMLADVLQDPQGLDFTVAFVDRVIRPEDPRAAAQELQRLAAHPPAFLPAPLRRIIALGGPSSAVAPHLVVATARRMFRQLVSHLIVDAREPFLRRAIERLSADGSRVNVNLLGEAVLGAREAEARLQGVRDLVARPHVDYVSIKVSSIVEHVPLWAAQTARERIVTALLPLYMQAAQQKYPTFINMDMEEYRDLELTVDVFESLMNRPELQHLSAGIVLQAYVPDSLRAYRRLLEFAQRRVAAGGAPLKVRIVKGANLAMERVDASVHGWPLVTWPSKELSDAHYKRILMDALTRENLQHLHVGIASHNLFDIAFAHLLMQQRGIPGGPGHGVEFEMLAGMAPAQQAVVREAVGTMRVYLPVVNPDQFDVAVSYLVRRLDENASSENFMSAVFDLDSSAELFAREEARFARSLQTALGTSEAPDPFRTQDRSAESREGAPQLGSATLPATPGNFRNTPDTDTSTRANQHWAQQLAQGVRTTTLGTQQAAAAAISSTDDMEHVIAKARAAQPAWAHRTVGQRAAVLREAARLLAAERGPLLQLMAVETGKTLDQGDPEVSEAIDFALYYADQAEQLAACRDAGFAPRALTLVTPPWNFPLAITVGGMLAPLVTGSAVVVKPAPQAVRVGAYAADLLQRAGLPEGVLTVVDVPENDVGRALITDPRIDQVILTGAAETAELFASWRPQLRIKAETSGKNAIIVTPHADLDLAARDVVASAFGHAGQKCSAASLVITVGSVTDSRRFNAQLADAIRSLHVGWPDDPTVQMGPVIEPPGEKLRAGLTQLGDGERWLMKPEPLDDSGRLFSPGVRTGVKEGSTFHRTEYFGPILGIMHAETLADAVRMQNGTDFGLTAGLHSLDEAEIEWWIEHVQAGNLYVNRGITGAIVQRQPFGGWKRSAIGQTAKAGGPNYLVHLMDARDPGGQDDQPHDEAWLKRAQHSDRDHFATTFAPRDVQNLHGEANLLRYLPAQVCIRAGADAQAVQLRRILHAARTTSADFRVSVASTELREVAAGEGVPEADIRVEGADAFAAGYGDADVERVRVIGSCCEQLLTAAAQNVQIALYREPVVASGRVELLTFLKEQSISATTHRYGNPLPRPLRLNSDAGFARG